LLSIGLLPKQFIGPPNARRYLVQFLARWFDLPISINLETVFSSCLQYILFQPLSVFKFFRIIIVPETTKKPEIEDDFLNGQRLDPKTDGRPDPRPTVREDVPILGDLSNDFDFSQTPRSPLVLSAMYLSRG
jgi:hypothetical protein